MAEALSTPRVSPRAGLTVVWAGSTVLERWMPALPAARAGGGEEVKTTASAVPTAATTRSDTRVRPYPRTMPLPPLYDRPLLDSELSSVKSNSQWSYDRSDGIVSGMKLKPDGPGRGAELLDDVSR